MLRGKPSKILVVLSALLVQGCDTLQSVRIRFSSREPASSGSALNPVDPAPHTPRDPAPTPSEQPSDGELIVNGDFSSGLAPWNPAGDSRIVLAPNSGQILPSSSCTSSFLTQEVLVKPHTQYAVSFAMSTDTLSGRFFLTLSDQNTSSEIDGAVIEYDPSQDFTDYSVVINTHNAQRIVFQLGNVCGSHGVASFTDISMTEQK